MKSEIKQAKLRAIAVAATQPGPWAYYKNDDGDCIVLDANGCWVANAGNVETEAAHIAAAHPQLVISLLDETEQLRKTLDDIGYFLSPGATKEGAPAETVVHHIRRMHAEQLQAKDAEIEQLRAKLAAFAEAAHG